MIHPVRQSPRLETGVPAFDNFGRRRLGPFTPETTNRLPRPASVQIGREIFANDYDDELIRVFDAATGAHVRDLPNGFFEGMGFVAGELFVSETTGPGALNVINVYDADTFAHLRTLDVSAAVPGSMIAGLRGDGLPQGAAVDYYQVVVDANGALLLETALPAGGPGEFQNGLYPALALYEAGGALVADADGNVDGRNSRLEFAAGETPSIWEVPNHSTFFQKSNGLLLQKASGLVILPQRWVKPGGVHSAAAGVARRQPANSHLPGTNHL